MGTGWSQRKGAMGNTNNQNAKVDVSKKTRWKLISNKVDIHRHTNSTERARVHSKRNKKTSASCWTPFSIRSNSPEESEKISLVFFPTSKKPPPHPNHASKPMFPKAQKLTFSETTTVREFTPRPPSQETSFITNQDERRESNELESIGNCSIQGADDIDRMPRPHSRARESDKVVVYPYAENPKTPRDPVAVQETHNFTYYCLPQLVDLPAHGRVSSIRRVRPASPGWSINTTLTVVNRTSSWKSSLENLSVHEAQMRQEKLDSLHGDPIVEYDRLSTLSSVTTDPGDRHVIVLNELIDRSSLQSRAGSGRLRISSSTRRRPMSHRSIGPSTPRSILTETGSHGSHGSQDYGVREQPTFVYNLRSKSAARFSTPDEPATGTNTIKEDDIQVNGNNEEDSKDLTENISRENGSDRSVVDSESSLDQFVPTEDASESQEVQEVQEEQEKQQEESIPHEDLILDEKLLRSEELVPEITEITEIKDSEKLETATGLLTTITDHTTVNDVIVLAATQTIVVNIEDATEPKLKLLLQLFRQQIPHGASASAAPSVTSSVTSVKAASVTRSVTPTTDELTELSKELLTTFGKPFNDDLTEQPPEEEKEEISKIDQDFVDELHKLRDTGEITNETVKQLVEGYRHKLSLQRVRSLRSLRLEREKQREQEDQQLQREATSLFNKMDDIRKSITDVRGKERQQFDYRLRQKIRKKVTKGSAMPTNSLSQMDRRHDTPENT